MKRCWGRWARPEGYCPRPRPTERRVAGAVPGGLEDGDEERQPDRQRDQQEVEDRRDPELPASELEGRHVFSCRLGNACRSGYPGGPRRAAISSRRRRKLPVPVTRAPSSRTRSASRRSDVTTRSVAGSSSAPTMRTISSSAALAPWREA